MSPDPEVTIKSATLSTGIMKDAALVTVTGSLKSIPPFYYFHYKVHLRCNGNVFDSMQTPDQDWGRVNPIVDMDEEPKVILISAFYTNNFTDCEGQPLIFVKRVAKNNDNDVLGCDRLEFQKGWIERTKRFTEYLS